MTAPAAACWSDVRVQAEIGAAARGLGLAGPTVTCNGGGRANRVVVWFDDDAADAVDALLLALLVSQGAEPDGVPCCGPAYGDFRVYRAETGYWHGWFWSLQCRVHDGIREATA